MEGMKKGTEREEYAGDRGKEDQEVRGQREREGERGRGGQCVLWSRPLSLFLSNGKGGGGRERDSAHFV